jgi:hypothetical protein
MGNIHIHKRQAQAVMKSARELCGKAEIMAKNRAAAGSLSDTSKFIRKGYNIKLKDLNNKDNVRVSKANKNGAKVRIYFKEKGIGLIKFAARWIRRKPGATAAEKR